MAEPAVKTGWTRVAFGDVVRLCKERSRNPEADGYQHYVGLEHLDAGDLRIRRRGNVADGTTFTSVFRPGQVLFGKRRAYQRKVAVAEFSGVCSGDIYVFEPKNEHLLPELLPFICQADAFFEHAIGTSAGSLSPRTNWKSLADYEFALPPREEQRRIAEVFSAFEAMRESLRVVAARLESVAVSALDTMVASLNACEKVPLALVCQDSRPLCYGVVQPGAESEPGVPMIRVCDIENNELQVKTLKRISREVDEQYKRSRLAAGDVLVSVVGTIGRIFVVSPAEEGFNIARAIARISPDHRIASEFLAAYLRTRKLQATLISAAFETARKTLNLEVLGSLEIPVPPREYQMSWIERLVVVDQKLTRLRAQATETAEVQRSFSARCFASMC